MRRRTTFTPGPRTRRIAGRRRPRALVLVGAPVAVLSLALGAVVATPGESRADPRQPTAGVVVLLDCVRAWVRGADGAFAAGGVCDAARAELAARVAPSVPPTSAATVAVGTVPVPSPAGATSTSTAPSASTVPSSAAPARSAPGTPTPSAPSSSATAVPATSAATASASPSPSASASPAASAGSDPIPFGSRPLSGPITCSGRTGVVIRNSTFRGIGDDTPAITIDGCHDVLIEGNDFDADAEPIFVRNSTDVRIIGNRYKDIAGPHERNGSHRGNFTQWENSFGGEISGNSGIGGDTEDVISIYKSGGKSAAEPLVISGNVFQGTDWTSASGSGIMLGDGGGDHVLVQGNTLIDVGQVGIGVAGGSDIRILDNTVIGRARPNSNVGIYTWGQGAPCSDVTVARNRIDFVKADGTRSPRWDGGNCGPVAGWLTNIDLPLDRTGLLPRL